jgi:putative CocE/NonD family hydrolase
VNTAEFLSHLRDLGISLWVDGDSLRYNAPKGALAPDILSELVDRKTEILTFLKERDTAKKSAALLSQTDEATTKREVPFVAPRTPVENTLAEIWMQVLDLEQVSVHDNFFELGGNSLLGMRVIARSNQAGLKFMPQQFLEHQTIAELAAVEGVAWAQGRWDLATGAGSAAQATDPECIRTSQYITVRDGTKLAVDIFRPAQDGRPIEDPLPVIWTHHYYHRADIWEGRLITELDRSPWLQTLLRHGYVIAAVDVRGQGASYGTWQGPFSRAETLDAYDVTAWLAAQPWSNGKIGMYGRSYLGITQYMAASTLSPHLKAIVPEMALFDLYAFAYPGGVFHHDFGVQWGLRSEILDAVPVAPVDEDSDCAMLAEAIQEHKTNRDVVDMFAPLHYRDSHDPQKGIEPYVIFNPASYMREIRKSRVAIYHVAGWYDAWPRDALLWFSNLDNPQKIIIGPWSHNEEQGWDIAAAHLRWYDYWLKGIDNGIMDQAPIHYYTMGATSGQEWRSAWEWPLSNQRLTKYYFRGKASGSINSVNDGSLSISPPKGDTGKDDYKVDYATTSGQNTRWDDTSGMFEFDRLDMVFNDLKGLTYTSPPLDADIEVTGHPAVHLWVTLTAKDGDFFVYLEEVDRVTGSSSYVSEGTLRASHRAIATPPFNYLGLPYHSGLQRDITDLPDEPVELVFDLHPISNVFHAGNRIRVTLTCADSDNALTPRLSPAPTISVYRNAKYASYITLPIIPVAVPNAAASGSTETRLSGVA